MSVEYICRACRTSPEPPPCSFRQRDRLEQRLETLLLHIGGRTIRTEMLRLAGPIYELITFSVHFTCICDTQGPFTSICGLAVTNRLAAPDPRFRRIYFDTTPTFASHTSYSGTSPHTSVASISCSSLSAMPCNIWNRLLKTTADGCICRQTFGSTGGKSANSTHLILYLLCANVRAGNLPAGYPPRPHPHFRGDTYPRVDQC